MEFTCSHNLFTFQNSLKFREKKLLKMFIGDMLEIISYQKATPAKHVDLMVIENLTKTFVKRELPRNQA